MGVTLVVLPDADFRERLCREFVLRGLDASGVPDWSTAFDIGAPKDPAAVVFDPGQLSTDGATWQAGLDRLRARRPDIRILSLSDRRTGRDGQPNPTNPTHPFPACRPDGTASGVGAAMSAREYPDAIVAVPISDNPADIARWFVRKLAPAGAWHALKVDFDDLHARLLGGDPWAADEIWTLVHRRLYARLRAWPHAAAEPGEVIEDAVMDALARYLTQPGVYDARRSHPMEWLLAIARNEIRHRWRARKSRPRSAQRI
jgi:hypothetical protein